MTNISLGYGKSSVSFEFNPDRFEVISGNSSEEIPLTDVQIGDALDNPIDSPPLENLLSTGETVLIVVSDATRATGSAQIVNLLVRRLIEAGISPADIAIIFATGIHRPVTSNEKSELLTPFIFQRVRTIDHNANDPSSMVSLGTTKRGTPIEVNRALKQYSHVIITGGIGFHYFAGFTGGRKSICPGLASAETIQATHMLAMDFNYGGRRAGVATGALDGNAVHEECESVAALVNPSFSVNALVDDRGRVVRVCAGNWRNAHRRACDSYMASHSIEIQRRRELVVVSCGGDPYDLNMIQAHKALDMAANACTDGGTIILLAECRDGLGQPSFLKWFAEDDSVHLAGRLRGSYEVNGQTAWSLLTKTERFKVYLVSSLTDEETRAMRMTPARSLTDALSDVGSVTEGFIMPRGAAILPHVSQRLELPGNTQ
jgi:nickel-dependent lactate racemase